jgi:hypothetical protein
MRIESDENIRGLVCAEIQFQVWKFYPLTANQSKKFWFYDQRRTIPVRTNRLPVIR